MSHTEVYFKEIKSKIIETIQMAQDEILIAVAWFTDTKIIEELVKSASRGVDVQIIIFDDKVNNKDLFKELYYKKGDIRVSKKLMHNKFCVIDKTSVINGSYNWTYSASSNNENIQITTNNDSLANSFVLEFYKLQENCVKISYYFNEVQVNFSEYFESCQKPKYYPCFFYCERSGIDIFFLNPNILLQNIEEFKELCFEIFNRSMNSKYQTSYKTINKFRCYKKVLKPDSETENDVELKREYFNGVLIYFFRFIYFDNDLLLIGNDFNLDLIDKSMNKLKSIQRFSAKNYVLAWNYKFINFQNYIGLYLDNYFSYIKDTREFISLSGVVVFRNDYIVYKQKIGNNFSLGIKNYNGDVIFHPLEFELIEINNESEIFFARPWLILNDNRLAIANQLSFNETKKLTQEYTFNRTSNKFIKTGDIKEFKYANKLIYMPDLSQEDIEFYSAVFNKLKFVDYQKISKVHVELKSLNKIINNKNLSNDICDRLKA